VPTKSPRSGPRKRRGNKRDQQNSAKVTNAAGSVVKDIIVSIADQRPSVSSDLSLHSVPLLNTMGCLPTFSSTHPSRIAGSYHAGLVMAPTTLVDSTRMPTIRFINGDDSPARFPKHTAPGTIASLRLTRGRQDSSSSTDSAETVRHLEHGTCVGNVDRYLTASAVMQSSAGSAPVRHTCGAFAAPTAVSSAQGMRFYFRPALLSGVSFPASRSELEQYKQVLHGSAHIPPTDSPTVSTPEPQVTRARQRSPGRGRGHTAAIGASSSVSRNVMPVVATNSVPRFFSVGMVPSSQSVPSVRGVTQTSITAVHGVLRNLLVHLGMYMI